MICITNRETGESVQIHRDVATAHPDWVHEQMGTEGEVELQRGLDTLHVDDWYDEEGCHLGPDVNGVEMFR